VGMEPSTPDDAAPIHAVQLLIGTVVLLWGIEIVDSVFLGDALQAQGIRPRTWSGFDGILWAPFLHGSLGHLISNTIPFIVVGGIVMLRGIRLWSGVTLIVMVVGGLLVWLLARPSLHIGASILIFGYLGYLAVVGFFEKDLRWIAVGFGVMFVYGGTLIVGILPIQRGISWEGHLFGLAGGVLAAYLLRSPD